MVRLVSLTVACCIVTASQELRMLVAGSSRVGVLGSEEGDASKEVWRCRSQS